MKTIIASFALGMIFQFMCSRLEMPRANAQMSPAAPDDIKGIRLAVEDIARSQRKIADSKK